MITTPGKVRDVMGLDEEVAVDDEQIFTIIGIAEKRIRRELFDFHSDITPDGNPDTGTLWNGSNTSFMVNGMIMDYDFDGSTSDDVAGYWLGSDMTPYDASVVVSNARYGRLTITRDDGVTAIPSNAYDVKIDYYSCDEDVPFSVMEELGTLLTSHFVTLRLTEPRKISLADLESNRRILEVRNNQFVVAYKDLLRGYQPVMMEAT